MWAFKRNIGILCLILAICVISAAPAKAVFISVIDDNGNGVSDFSDTNELDFDISWNNFGPVWLQVNLASGDTGPLAFSGFHFNLTGRNWTNFHLELEDGATWQEINAIDPGFGGLATTIVDPTKVWLFFDPPIPPDGDFLILGEPDDDIDSGVDWFIDISGVTGDTFSIHVHPTPEPGTILLLVAGLAACWLSLQRRHQNLMVG